MFSDINHSYLMHIAIEGPNVESVNYCKFFNEVTVTSAFNAMVVPLFLYNIQLWVRNIRLASPPPLYDTLITDFPLMYMYM